MHMYLGVYRNLGPGAPVGLGRGGGLILTANINMTLFNTKRFLKCMNDRSRTHHEIVGIGPAEVEGRAGIVVVLHAHDEARADPAHKVVLANRRPLFEGRRVDRKLRRNVIVIRILSGGIGERAAQLGARRGG